MANFAEQIREYFRTTPKDVLEEEWDRIHSEFNFGPNVMTFIEETQKFISSNSMNVLIEPNEDYQVNNSFGKDAKKYCLAA